MCSDKAEHGSTESTVCREQIEMLRLPRPLCVSATLGRFFAAFVPRRRVDSVDAFRPDFFGAFVVWRGNDSAVHTDEPGDALMKLGRVTMGFLSVAFAANEAAAQSGASLTTSIERGAVVFAQSGNGKTVAVLNFPGNDQCLTRLSAFVSEQLTVDLANALGTGGTVVERSQIMQLLQEDRLATVGLTAQEASRLGKRLGAHLLLVGTKTVLGSEVILNARLVSTDGGAMVKAFRISGSVPAELLALEKELEGPQQPGCSRRPAPRDTDGASLGSRDEPSMAVMNDGPLRSPKVEPVVDLGLLRVSLKSAATTRLQANGRLQGGNGLRCVLELTNRDSQRSLVVAANAEPVNPSDPNEANAPLRSSAVDERGTVWRTISLTGLPFVRAGIHGSLYFQQAKSHPASDIVRLLELRDKLGRDTDDPSDGYRAAYNNAWVPNKGNQFVRGSTIVIEPGQSIIVSMDLAASDPSAIPPSLVQINSEMIVGLVSPDGKVAYSLRTLLLDRIDVPPLRR